MAGVRGRDLFEDHAFLREAKKLQDEARESQREKEELIEKARKAEEKRKQSEVDELKSQQEREEKRQAYIRSMEQKLREQTDPNDERGKGEEKQGQEQEDARRVVVEDARSTPPKPFSGVLVDPRQLDSPARTPPRPLTRGKAKLAIATKKMRTPGSCVVYEEDMRNMKAQARS